MRRIRYWGGFAGAVLLCGLSLAYPAEALGAVSESLLIWATGFAPALFPFFAMLPALSGEAAQRAYERVFGWALPVLFGCPARAAGGLLLGLMAGSPAGATALARCAGLTRGEASRALLLSASLSPAFLVTTVGVSLCASQSAGYALLAGQGLATLTAGILLRRAWRSDSTPWVGRYDAAPGSPMRDAVIGLATVAGYMALFALIARLATRLFPGLGAPLLPFLEIAGGCAVLARASLPLSARVPLIAFFCGLGGLSVAKQNLARAPIPPARYVCGKFLQATLCAGYARLCYRPSPPTLHGEPVAWAFAFAGGALVLCLFALDIMRRRAQ